MAPVFVIPFRPSWIGKLIRGSWTVDNVHIYDWRYLYFLVITRNNFMSQTNREALIPRHFPIFLLANFERIFSLKDRPILRPFRVSEGDLDGTRAVGGVTK